MGVTLEQHRSAIGRFKPSGSQRVSAKSRREIALSEVMAILAVTKIRREAKQVDTKLISNSQEDVIAGLAASPLLILCPLYTLGVPSERFAGNPFTRSNKTPPICHFSQSAYKRCESQSQ